MVRKSNSNLYSQNPLLATEIDTWIDFAASHLTPNASIETVTRSLDSLDNHLRSRTFLVGSQLSLADVAVAIALTFNLKTWSTIVSNKSNTTTNTNKYSEVQRWATHLTTLPNLGKFVHAPNLASSSSSASATTTTKESKASTSKTTTTSSTSASTAASASATAEDKDVGGFVKLPGAEMGKVVTRFPPEASGYLHIGHAKAALLNQYYALQHKGTLIFR